MTHKGLYLHIPFCIRKCNYCDFCSVPKADVTDAYIDRLISEASVYKEAERIPVNTVYFGGGTPSLLSPIQLRRIMSGLSDVFLFSPDCEITVEVNPGTADADKLAAYRALGVNRLSIGLQSIHENEMKMLGRIHDFPRFLDIFTSARKVGFDNISVDIMYGIPYQTPESFEKTLRALISLSPEHISVYGLIIEEGTQFFLQKDCLHLPDEDAECDMYYLADRLLCDESYSHYEISNYAKPGRESRHNLKYWRDMEYIGLGASAYSYFKGVRYGNTRSLSDYLSGKGLREDEIKLSDADVRYEYAMMRLRLKEGISLDEYRSLFGLSFTQGRENLISEYIKCGLMRLECGRLSFTSRGFYVSNSLLVNLL